MGDVLSQEEVDALLAGLTGGEIPTGTDHPPEPGSYTSYDFTNQDRVVRGKLPTLEMVHERFTRFFRQSISSAMQRIVDVNMLNADMTKFGEFMRSQSIPSSYHIFRLEPLKGSCLLVLQGKLVYTMVNNFFGGKGSSHYKMEGRDFTPIENRLIKTIVDIMLRDYEKAWMPVQRLQVSHTRNEVNPQFVSIVPTSDMVWVVDIEMSFEDVSERFFFCLPYSTIEPLKEKLKARFQSESMDAENTWIGRIEESLKSVPIRLSVRLGTAEISGRDALRLKIGDVIQLRKHSNTPLDVYVEDVLKMRGIAGASKGSKAVQISEIPTRKKENLSWATKSNRK